MRSMNPVILLLCLAPAGALVAAPPTAVSRCPDEALSHLARPGKGALHKKLTDLPPADAYLAVFRRDGNGCIVPVKIDFLNGRPSGRSPAEPPRQR